jgi:hypothetical protein
MILVQGIGMSGYVPLEGVVVLSHFLVDYCSDKYGYRHDFEYLGVREIDQTYNLSVLRGVVSFAVVHRFDDRVRSFIARDIGLLSGYYDAGVVFPNKLRSVFRDTMGLSEYHALTRSSGHPNYSSLNFVYTSAWSEYICLDPDASYASRPPIFTSKLAWKCPFPTSVCGELLSILSQ